MKSGSVTLTAELRTSLSLCFPDHPAPAPSCLHLRSAVGAHASWGRKQDSVDSLDFGACSSAQLRAFLHRVFQRAWLQVHIAHFTGIWLFCLELKQKWHKVSLISVISLMWWEKRKLASSLEEMLMFFHNFYNDI